MAETYYRVNESDSHADFIPIGKPLPGTQILLLDENKSLCEMGQEGEIFVRSPYLTLGYYRKPDLETNIFISNPITKDLTDRVYRTGDMGLRLDNQNYRFLGRKDRQVKLNGIRVELGEIENIMLQHDAIKQAVVIGNIEQQNIDSLHGYYLSNIEFSEISIKSYLKAYLPDNLIPSSFQQLDNIPLTLSGKVDRKALLNPQENNASYTIVESPKNETENKIYNIWKALLNNDKFSTNDDFFNVGGNSIRLIQLHKQLIESFDTDLRVVELFERTTVAKISERITDENKKIDFSEVNDRAEKRKASYKIRRKRVYRA
jgi:long-subunit acyl-CoA synthetase (AMP-forming)